MSEQDLVDRLTEHRTLGGASRAELEWLVAHGQVRKLNAGELLSVKGMQVEALYIILSGRLALFIDRGNGPSKLIEWRGGDVAGMLPYSRLMTAPGNSIAQEPAEILAIPRIHMQAMTQECFQVTSILVHTMLDRTRSFTSSDLLNEKMISLGKLSAGLAHELNNPASAIERCGAILKDRMETCEEASRDLAAMGLSEAQMAAIDSVRAHCFAKQATERTPLEQSDREEAMVGWLASNGLDVLNAGMLADTEVTLTALDSLVSIVDRPVLNAVVRWAAAGCSVRNLAGKMQNSAAHISNLVKAVKGFTHMDQANIAEAVDLGRSLGDTAAVLQAKAREKSVTVALELDHKLPKVRGFAGELSQVWGNLIDNALDAAAHGGRVAVGADREDRSVVVRIVDDGPGIPDDVKHRIFDPFFTTKPQGMGTGLGLDIVRRLVSHNDGAIEFETRPGRTEFRVKLPVADGQAGS